MKNLMIMFVLIFATSFITISADAKNCRRGYCSDRVKAPGKIVTRNCRIKRVTSRGHRIQVYFGTATGRKHTGVKKRACTRARIKCEKHRVRAQRCRKV